MKKYSNDLVKKIQQLRSAGYTYTEIQHALNIEIPKSSLSYICKDVTLNRASKLRIQNIIKNNANKARLLAVQSNRQNFHNKIQSYHNKNIGIADFMNLPEAKIIALCMLYLGEGAKWQTSRAPKLSSSSSQIVLIYIDLLKQCYGIGTANLRARVQYRADQDYQSLVDYWSNVTRIPKENFYKGYMDKRTIGKKTKKENYKGVCTISCSGTYIQLELDAIAGIISRALRGISAVG